MASTSSNTQYSGFVPMGVVAIDPNFDSSLVATNDETSTQKMALATVAAPSTTTAVEAKAPVVADQGRNDEDIFSITSAMFQRFGDSFNWNGAAATNGATGSVASLHDEEDRDVDVATKENKKVDMKSLPEDEEDEEEEDWESGDEEESEYSEEEATKSRSKSQSRRLLSLVAGEEGPSKKPPTKSRNTRSSLLKKPSFLTKKDKRDGDARGIDKDLKKDVQKTLGSFRKSARKAGMPEDLDHVKGAVDEVFLDPDFVEDVRHELSYIVESVKDVIHAATVAATQALEEDDAPSNKKYGKKNRKR